MRAHSMASLARMPDGCGRVQLEILRTIVVAHTIAVVHRLVGLQVAPQLLFDDQDVLEDEWASSCPRVVRHSYHHVTRFVARLAALPVSVRRSRDRTTIRARL